MLAYTGFWSKRVILFMLATVLAVVCSAIQVSLSSPSNLTEAFANPPEIVSANGVLTATLEASLTTIKVAGKKVLTPVYNKSFIPPTLRARPGDILKVTLINQLTKEIKINQLTNLHYHGMVVSPARNSDNVFVHVKPGESFAYEVKIPMDHPSGLFWYHPHVEFDLEEQVLGGMSGAIIIDGILDKLPQFQGIAERIILLKDIQVTKDGTIPENIDSDAPTTRLVNGLLMPTLTIRPGETQLWRFANIGADIFYEIKLSGYTFHEIAQDGNPLVEVWDQQTLVLPPGKRAEVLVQGRSPNTAKLDTLTYSTGPQGDSYPHTTLATVISTGAAVKQTPIPTKRQPSVNLANEPIAQKRTFIFSENGAGTEFYINGKQFDHNRVDTVVKLGTTEEWTIKNVTQELHPFHIHVNDFQVMSINGVPQPFRGLQDTVILPYDGEVVVRMRFERFLGKYVYHCHILAHEDAGMMGVLEVSP